MAINDHELGRLLGKIEQQNMDARKSREIMRLEWKELTLEMKSVQRQHSEILQAVGDLTKDHAYLKATVFDHVIPHVNDYKVAKQRGIGMWKLITIIGGIAGALGAAIVAGFNSITHFFKG